MPKFIFLLLFSLFFTFLLAPQVIDVLYRLNIRKRAKAGLDEFLGTHRDKRGVPLMGGLIVILPVLLLNIFLNRSPEVGLLLLVTLGGTLIGFGDDLLNVFGHERLTLRVRESVNPWVAFSEVSWRIYRLFLWPWNRLKGFFTAMGSTASGLRAHEKFLLESFLALGVSSWLYFGLNQQAVWLPFLGERPLGIFYIPLIALLLVVFASAFGLTDGLDGLSAGTHALSFLAYGVIAYQLGLLPLAYFCAILTGAELAFLYFNIYPARIEMSDVGTVPLGMVFVLVGVLTNRLWLLPILGLIFILEIGSSFFQILFLNLGRGKILLMAPLHHHFEMKGWPEAKVTMRFWLLATVTSFLGIFLSFF